MTTPAQSRGWVQLQWRPTRPELMALLGVIAVSSLVALLIIAEGAPLGHDEALYALKSRHLQNGGESAWYWRDYRAPGLPLMLQLTWLIRGTEPFLRLTVWAFGALGIVLTWLAGRSLFDARTGVFAAAGLSLTLPWLASSTTVWPDVPGAVLGMGVILIVLAAIREDHVSWWILLAGPLSWLAVLTRYGAWLPIGIGVLAVFAWRWRALKRAWPQLLVLGLGTGAGTLLIVAVPWLVGANESPLRAIRNHQESVGRPITQGIIDYAQSAAFILGGFAGPLLIVGLALSVLYLITRPAIRHQLGFVLAIVAVTAVALALVLHGEYRYLSPVYPFAWVAAGAGLAKASRSIPRDVAVVAALAIGVAAPWSAFANSDIETDRLKVGFGDLRLVSSAINDEHGYEECGVISSYVPQVGWYSDCVVRAFAAERVLSSYYFPSQEADYLLMITDGKRQPEGEVLEAYLDATDGILIESGDPYEGSYQYAVVYIVDDDQE